VKPKFKHGWIIEDQNYDDCELHIMIPFPENSSIDSTSNPTTMSNILRDIPQLNHLIRVPLLRLKHMAWTNLLGIVLQSNTSSKFHLQIMLLNPSYRNQSLVPVDRLRQTPHWADHMRSGNHLRYHH